MFLVYWILYLNLKKKHFARIFVSSRVLEPAAPSPCTGLSSQMYVTLLLRFFTKKRSGETQTLSQTFSPRRRPPSRGRGTAKI